MSRPVSFLMPLVALAACGEPTFSYTLEAELVVPEEVARSVGAPALVEVEWMGETRGIELLCEEPEGGEVRVTFEDTVESAGHLGHQLFTARLVPWPEEVPCDPEAIDTFSIDPDEPVPFAHVFVFEDDAGFLGGREKERAESVTVELAYEE